MLDSDEAYFKEHGEPLFSSHMIDLSEESVYSGSFLSLRQTLASQISRTTSSRWQC